MAEGWKVDEPGAAVISAKMAKALASPWRSRILTELNLRPMSPSQFVDEIGGEISNIARCFRQLAAWDYIEVAEERTGGRRRGGVEHVYRAVQRPHFDTATWERVPRFLRNEISASFLESYFAQITEAINAGTFDAETDRHLSWDLISLDRQAWKELGDKLDEVLALLPELEAEAAARMAESGEEPIPTTVGLAAFRSPKPSEIPAKPRKRPR